MNAEASILLGVATMLGFGVADFMAKTMLTKGNAIVTAFISQSIGSLLYLSAALAYDRAYPSVAIACLALFSGVISGVVLCAYYLALSLGKASLVAPIFSCLTVVAVSLSILILHEALTVLQFSSIGLVFLGVILVAFERKGGEPLSHRLSLLLALSAAVLGGGNLILQKWIADSEHYLMGFLLSRTSMAIFVGPLAAHGQGARSPKTQGSWLKLALLGLIDVSAFFAWYIGLRVGQVSVVTPIATSSPAVTVVLAHLFLKERVRLHQQVGILAILFGIVLLSVVS